MIIYYVITTVLVLIYFLFILLFVRLNRTKNKYQNRFYESISAANSFGYTISIFAPIGSGKTALAGGLSTIYTLLNIQKINEVMNKYKRVMHDIDFRYFNYVLVQLIKEQEYSYHLDYELITKKLLSEMKIYNYYIYDFTNATSIYEMTLDYVVAFESMFVRNNYIFSKTKFLSPITFNINLVFDSVSTEIKEKPNSFNLKPYSTIIHDEASDDKAASTWQEAVKNGSKEFKSKIRHIFKETVRAINIKQDYTDEVKKERNLNQSLIEVLGFQKVNENKTYYKMAKRYYKRKYRFYFIRLRLRFFGYFIKNIVRFRKTNFNSFIAAIYDEENKYRLYEYRIENLNNFIDSMKYLKFLIRVYSRESDIGKDIDNYLELYIPLKYCFIYPRFEYDQTLYDLLLQSNTASAEDNYFNKKSLVDKPEKKNNERDDDYGFD